VAVIVTVPAVTAVIVALPSCPGVIDTIVGLELDQLIFLYDELDGKISV